MASVASDQSGHILHNLLLFGHLLRRLGLNVHEGRMVDAVRVLEDIGMTRRMDVASALRTLLVHRKDDLPLFDEAFEVFWRQRKDRMSSLDLRSMGEQRRYRRVEAGPPPPGRLDDGSNSEAQDPEEQYDRIDLTRTFSTRDVLREKDFAEFTPEETLQARQLMASLQWNPGLRLTRRQERGRGPRLDVRRTLRDNAQFGGELLRLRTRRRKEKARRLVVICDVSGSMERYTRMLLHFIHSLYAGLVSQVEAFLFATRLTRITKQLGQRDIDQAVSEVSKAVPDWSGGTRIGAALREFNYRWARRTLGWGSIVLIVSDGWDRGEPEALREEMARLQRSCRRLIWLNPLAGADDYEPLTQGMQAAAPYIDDLLPVHNLAALLDLARHLNGLTTSWPVRRQAPPSVVETAEVVTAPPGQRSWHAGANPSFRHPMWGHGSGERGGRRVGGRMMPAAWALGHVPSSGVRVRHPVDVV